MLRKQRHSLSPSYLYSQSESHIMAAEMRTTTLPRASASTWRNTPWCYHSWRYQRTYMTFSSLRIASWRYCGYYQLCSSGPHWQGLWPENIIEVLTKNMQGEGEFAGCHLWSLIIPIISTTIMNHLLFFAMLVRMLVTNICFILLSILMTCSNKVLQKSSWPVQCSSVQKRP